MVFIQHKKWKTSIKIKKGIEKSRKIFPNYNQPKTAASELAEVMAEQKYGKVFGGVF